jgi:hypothetical protein
MTKNTSTKRRTHGTSKRGLEGVFGRMFHSGCPAMSGPKIASTASSNLLFVKSVPMPFPRVPKLPKKIKRERQARIEGGRERGGGRGREVD